MDVASRTEARRTAWGLLLANLQMQAGGPETVSTADIQALAEPLNTAADWGMLAAALTEIAAQAWIMICGDPDAAVKQARMAALGLAAGEQ